MIYLYVKTHKKTGLKYLGKTVASDPHAYKGSGVVWKDHCSKHGFDYTTEILFQSTDKEEIKTKGIYYSELWNVVECNDWANLKREECDGGFCSNSITPLANSKRSEKLKGRVFSEEHRKKLSDAAKTRSEAVLEKIREQNRSPERRALSSKTHKGKVVSEETKQKMSQASKGRKMSDTAKSKMKMAWSDERKAAQSDRRRLMNLTRPVSTCPHCGKQSKNKGNMNRYHFNNCAKCLQ